MGISTITWKILFIFVLTVDIQTALARQRRKRTDEQFNNDDEVKQYLKRRNRDMSIFHCKKVVMVQWLHSIVPYVDLECEVLGDVTGVSWYFNDTLINTDDPSGRYISLSQRHFRKRNFFNNWFDYKLRLLQVTKADNGPYTLKLSSPEGYVQQRDIMLDVETDYREEKWLKWNKDKKNKKKQRSRRRIQKLRKRELMRELRKRSARRKKKVEDPFIFDD